MNPVTGESGLWRGIPGMKAEFGQNVPEVSTVQDESYMHE